jgi:hypothetical protein
VCSVTDLDDAGAGGGPAGLGVAPEELEVDDGVGWGGFDELLEDGRPLVHLHAGHSLHAVEDLLLVDGVAPRLLLGTGDLGSLVACNKFEYGGAYVVVHDPNHDILSRECKRVGRRAGRSQYAAQFPVCKSLTQAMS